MGFEEFSTSCPYRIEIGITPRAVNGLNIEIAQAADRCILKRPAHWPETATALRWIGSGGDPLVFGVCEARKCSLGHEWCPSCGHRKEDHLLLPAAGCSVGIGEFPCGCEHFQGGRRPRILRRGRWTEN